MIGITIQKNMYHHITKHVSPCNKTITVLEKRPFTVFLNISSIYSETIFNKTIIGVVFAINTSFTSIDNNHLCEVK